MSSLNSPRLRSALPVFLFHFLLLATLSAFGQPAGAPAPKNWTAEQDHQNMMEQLGITALRPGPSGNESAPNHANYDESKANPFPDLPDALTLKDGTKVTTPALWWQRRRPEIVEDFEREVFGRVPPTVPPVSWTVTATSKGTSGGRPIVEKQLTGHVDNSSYPLIEVNIEMTLVTPADAARPVPVMMMFGRAGARRPAAASADPPATEQLIADGWGYAYLNPISIQADNGAGLTRGIIGLVNKGQPRKPDDWGALRAWAWGASRGLDYLETDRAVDAKHVGIEGVSRYGKAALVTMAFDPRFAVVLVGSSGEGGAKLHRRNWGEAVENLTGSGEYHWMAGNFLKYGAAEAAFGSKNAGDLPVDAHELIALCAPRATFISYGVPEKGDAKWPPVNVGLLDGELAWRQHDGGHTDGPNWKYFISWADREFRRRPAPDRPVARLDRNSQIAHQQLLEKAKAGGIDLYFEGDSITRRWGATDYPELLADWKRNFFGWNAADFGWGADRVQNILWRLEFGELDGVNPKAIVLLAGTNDVGAGASAEDVEAGIREVVRVMQAKAPAASIVLMGIFPRHDRPQYMAEIERINARLAEMADGKRVRYLNVNARMGEGTLNAKDKLHPTLAGYEVWAEALKPVLTEILGPRALEDHAPPPTGDPSREGRVF